MAEDYDLYRHFNRDGVLLYVGISLSAIARLVDHRDVAPWFGDIANVGIERFATKAEALAAECKAIQDEKPLYNIVHVVPRKPRPAGVARKYSNRKYQPTAFEVAAVARAKKTAADGGGLFLQSGSNWIFRYRIDNRTRTIRLGLFELVGLRMARAACDDARRILRTGLDPADALTSLQAVARGNISKRPSHR